MKTAFARNLPSHLLRQPTPKLTGGKPVQKYLVEWDKTSKLTRGIATATRTYTDAMAFSLSRL